MPGHDAGGNEGDETRGMVPRKRCSPTRVWNRGRAYALYVGSKSFYFKS